MARNSMLAAAVVLLLTHQAHSAPVAGNAEYQACIASQSTCKKLVLDEQGLTGTVPTEVGTLTALTQLDLRHNSLTGPIPSEMGTLDALTTLWLSDNMLTGPMPSEMGSMDALEYLHLNNNMGLTGAAVTLSTGSEYSTSCTGLTGMDFSDSETESDCSAASSDSEAVSASPTREPTTLVATTTSPTPSSSVSVTTTSPTPSSSVSVSVSSDSDSDSDSEGEAWTGIIDPVRLVRQTMNVIRVLSVDQVSTGAPQFAMAAAGQACDQAQGEGWAPARFSEGEFDDQQPAVLQALDAQVAQNTTAMTGVQTADGSCMTVTSTGDGEAVWLQQECAAAAEMPTLCRNNFDDGGVAFVASTPCESCRQAEADAKGIDKATAKAAADAALADAASIPLTPALFFAGCVAASALLAGRQLKAWRSQKTQSDPMERQPLAPDMKDGTGATQVSSAIV